MKFKSSTSGSRKKLPEIESQILTLAKSIEILIADVENDLIDLGKKLQSIYSDTDNLAKTTAGFARENSEGSGLSGISSFTQAQVK